MDFSASQVIEQLVNDIKSDKNSRQDPYLLGEINPAQHFFHNFF